MACGRSSCTVRPAGWNSGLFKPSRPIRSSDLDARGRTVPSCRSRTVRGMPACPKVAW
jgi:hypothetical protein